MRDLEIIKPKGNLGKGEKAKYDAVVLGEWGREIWSVIALGFIFVDKVPLWWIHQRGISHEPKDGDDVHQSITSIYLQGQKGQEEWCTFQYCLNCRWYCCICLHFSWCINIHIPYLCQLSWTSKGFSSSPSLRSPDSWISYKAYSGT